MPMPRYTAWKHCTHNLFHLSTIEEAVRILANGRLQIPPMHSDGGIRSFHFDFINNFFILHIL